MPSNDDDYDEEYTQMICIIMCLATIAFCVASIVETAEYKTASIGVIIAMWVMFFVCGGLVYKTLKGMHNNTRGDPNLRTSTF